MRCCLRRSSASLQTFDPFRLSPVVLATNLRGKDYAPRTSLLRPKGRWQYCQFLAESGLLCSSLFDSLRPLQIDWLRNRVAARVWALDARSIRCNPYPMLDTCALHSEIWGIFAAYFLRRLATLDYYCITQRPPLSSSIGSNEGYILFVFAQPFRPVKDSTSPTFSSRQHNLYQDIIMAPHTIRWGILGKCSSSDRARHNY